MEACSLSAKNIACLRGDRLLFAGLSLELKAGDAVQILGPNGTGKSSLIRILSGLMRPFSGEVSRKGTVALIDERPALDEHLPLEKALTCWAKIDRANETSSTKIYGQLGLTDLLDVPVRYLSTGQRKRAALARLSGQNAPIWMLDEPLNGLDTAAISVVEKCVRDHCAGGGIAIIASHQAFDLPNLRAINITDFAP